MNPQPRPRLNSRDMLSTNERGRSPSPRQRNVNETSRPLLEPTVNNQGPPLAGPETDTESDDRDAVNKSYPGVDDGFFTNGNTGNTNTEVEIIPLEPAPPMSPKPNEIPNPRFPNEPRSPTPRNGREFPYSPGFGPGVINVPDYQPSEFNPLGEPIPDINYYQQKKTLAQGMMDIALFSANANQLRYVLESYDRHPYYYPSIVFIGLSLIIQVNNIITIYNLLFYIAKITLV